MTENEALNKLHAKILSSNLVERITEQEMMAFCKAKTALEEIQQYSAIGTIEECREAVEKQKPKKPIEKWTGNEWICECPACRGITDMPYEVDVKCIQYCGWCGQRLDWSDNE